MNADQAVRKLTARYGYSLPVALTGLAEAERAGYANDGRTVVAYTPGHGFTVIRLNSGATVPDEESLRQAVGHYAEFGEWPL